MSDRQRVSGSTSIATTRLSYLRGLDGIRAIAVAAVVVYHADLGFLPGGFLGVDVFFVLSGFLITSLLLAEWDGRASISLRTFWLRRARRLLPALFALLLVTLAFAVVVLPDSVARLRSDAAAAAAYVTNWYLISGEQSYFDTIDRQSPLLHLWSLAVEEQFYLAWPIVLGLALRFLRVRGAFFLTLAAAAASAGWMAVLAATGSDPSRVYYGTDTRIFAPLVGAALAFIALRASPGEQPDGPVLPRFRKADGVAVGALAVLVWFALTSGSEDASLYLGGLFAVAVAAAVLIAAVVHPGAAVAPWLLERAPMRWLGTRSYALYLWHWPVLSVTRPGLDVAIDGPVLLAVRLLAMGVAAELSYRFVERPIRHGALGRAWRAWRTAPGPAVPRLRLRLAAGGMAAVLPATGLAMAVLAATPPERPDYLPVDSWTGVIVDEPAPEQPGSEDPGSEDPGSEDPEPADPKPAGPRDPGAEAPVPGPTDGPPVGVPSGGTVRVGTRPHESLPPERPVLVIGDSIIIATGKALAREIGPIEIDAEVGRQAADGVHVLQVRRTEGRLSDVVVIDLGTNGPLMRAQFEEMMAALDGARLVVWVNVSVPRSWEDHTNLVLEQQVPRYPNARLVDWYGAANGRRELFRGDGYHPTPEGAALFASLVAEQLR